MIDIHSFTIRDREGDRLLDDVDLSIAPETLTVICGQPGSGKTLLLKAIKGIISEGLEKDGTIKKEGRAGIIFQEPRKQMVRRKVKMEAAFDLENRCCDKIEIEAKIGEYAEFLDAEDLLEKNIDELSHGELTKTALLSILVTEPEIVLFDEPLSTLDHSNKIMLLQVIKRLKENGTTVVIAEHDVRELVRSADRIVLLKDGLIMRDGKPEDIKRELYREGIKIPIEWKLGLMKDEARTKD